MLQNAQETDTKDTPGTRTLGFALAMLTGCILYYHFDDEPGLFSIACSVLICLILFFVSNKLTHWPVQAVFCLLSLLLLGGMCGLLSAKLATLRTGTITAESAAQPVQIEGWIQSVEPGQKGPRLRIKVHAIERWHSSQTPRTVRLTHRATLIMSPGRFVRCRAVLRAPPRPVIKGDFAFHRQAWFQGLGAVGYVQGRCRGGVLGKPAGFWRGMQNDLNILRRKLSVHIHRVAGHKAGGLAAALMTGDRSFLQAEDQEQLRQAGLAHLIAISGLHIGIVGGLVFLITRRGLAMIEPLALRLDVRKPAACLALISCLAYLILSGASISTQRAVLMASLFFGAILFERSALSFQSFAIAMILVLSMAPWSALSPGFQMSFSATAALIATYTFWQARRLETGNIRSASKPVFWLQSLIITACVTSFATLPFALYHFDRAAPLSVIANLLAMPVFSLLSAPLAGLALICAPFGLSELPLRLFGLSLEIILTIAARIADYSPEVRLIQNRLPAVTLMLWFFSAASLVWVSRTRIGWAVSSLLFVAGLCLWLQPKSNMIHWAPNGVLYAETARQSRAFQLSSGEGLAPLRHKGLQIREPCEPDTACIITLDEFGRSLIYLTRQASWSCRTLAGHDIILMEDQSSSCALETRQILVTRSQMSEQNGISLRRVKNRYVALTKPDCWRRPWETCLQGQSS